MILRVVGSRCGYAAKLRNNSVSESNCRYTKKLISLRTLGSSLNF